MVRDAPGLYLACSRAIVLLHVGQIPQVFCQIFHDSFSGTAAAGARSASLNQVIQTGVKRAAFSSEAGLGTAPMGA